MTQIEQEIINILDKEEKDYVTLNSLKKKGSIMRLLNLNKKPSQSDIKKKLQPHVHQAIRITEGFNQKWFAARNISDKELVFNSIQSNPRSLPQLRKNFVLKTQRLLTIVPEMVSSGQLSFWLKSDKFVMQLTANEFEQSKEMPQEEESCHITETDHQQMKEAYDHVGQGKSFVRIYQLREHLGWSRNRFDKTIEDLARKLMIQLHRSDPSVLSEEEIKNSYNDNDLGLCITLTWRNVS